MCAASDSSGQYDVVVIGSGFGGSVSALRLTEKGYRVGVLEAGRRFDASNLPMTSWDIRRFLWAPRLGCFGIQRIHLLRDVVILAGAGVGGGSLVYANTLYRPLDAFFDDPSWAGIADWRAELAPAYEQATRMLGAVTNPEMTPADEVIREVAGDMGVGETFRLTPVGVLFGHEGTPPGSKVDDPFFGGKGPSRRTCIRCGECMTGCRHGAKNTLDRNYLYLAEKAGAEVHPLTTVTGVRPARDGGYVVDAVRTGSSGRKPSDRMRFSAEQVVFAAGTYNTQKLLHRMRADGLLPRISDRLGMLTRTNSESILGAVSRRPDVDYTRGVAITSSFHPDEHTHIEPVRYGKGSNAMGLLQTVLTDGDEGRPRWKSWLAQVRRDPAGALRMLTVRHWSERTIILLVMQTLDNSITVSGGRGRGGRFKLTSAQGHGEPNPTWIPAGNDAARRVAAKIDGVAGGTIGEIANIPMTAHFIGGCAIGGSAETGVIDAWQRLFGYEGLHVIDGSAISANLGVNPSLTITAQAERAMSFWPNRGEADSRPPLGSRYDPIEVVPPRSPVVPDAAPGALRIGARGDAPGST